MSRLSDRRVVTFFALVLLSGVCLGLLGLRGLRTGDRFYDFFAWNLFLAWTPFVLALALYDARRRSWPLTLLLGLGALWLLSLPNAPYMITDFVHLGASGAAPLWFDGALIAAFAGTGLVLGLASLFLVHAVVAVRTGAAIGWSFVLGVLVLCGVGVYLGRFGRYNSWDVLTRPGELLALATRAMTDPLAHAEWLGFSLAFSGFLLVSYLLVYGATQLDIDAGRRP